MTGLKLQKRGYDFFVSYGHADLAPVRALVSFLRKPCGLSVWFDAQSGNAAQRSSELLAAGLGNARGALIVLSDAWMQSTWCRNEYEVALAEQRAHDGFEVVVMRIDDTEAPTWMTVAEIIDFREATASSVARLLQSLSSDVPHRFDNDQDVYLAAPWSRPTDATRVALKALRLGGWRLVGDPPEASQQGAERIDGVLRTTRGAIAILGLDPARRPACASPFILEEAELAVRAGCPVLLLAEAGVSVPEPLAAAAFGGAPVVLSATSERDPDLQSVLQSFDDELSGVAHDDSDAYVFLAGSLRYDQTQSDELVAVMERASNMPCVRGERLVGDNVQAAIIDRVRRAAVVIADVTDDPRNTLIEAGVAMGSGTTLKLIVHAPDGVIPKKRFMFEGHEVFGYASPEERLGLCYWIARQFRRRVYVLR
jgi:hypothetical protein